MATTTNYSWTTPDDTDLVKDGAAAIRTLGSSADTTVKNLNPGTTAGDIDYYTSATAKARIAIGTAGQVLQVNAGATAPEWAAPAGGGKVLQVVQGTSTTSTTITSTSFVTTNLSATITPSSTNSKVLALIALMVYCDDNTQAAKLGYQLKRASTAVYVLDGGSANGFQIFSQGAASVAQTIVLNGNYLDTPATTSATTYTVEAKVPASQSAVFQVDSMPSTLILMEIGA
jgi:hypothetical protein